MFPCHQPPAAARVLCGCTPRRPCCRTCGPGTPHLCATCVFCSDPLDLVCYFFGDEAAANAADWLANRHRTHPAPTTAPQAVMLP